MNESELVGNAAATVAAQVLAR